MSDTPEQRHATLILWLLLDQGGSPPPGMTVDWPLLLALARQNSVLVRVTERLERVGLPPPGGFAAAAERERERAHTARSVMRHVAERCARHGVDFLFPTGWQHFPDAGGDLDLVVLSRDPRIDALILDGLAASLRARDLRDRVAGTALYWLRDAGLALDVHHGRLGLVGEHATYPAALIRRRQRRIVAGEECFVPAPEDQLILQGMSRVAGRRSFSIADVVTTVTTVLTQPLDWSYLVGVARRLGLYSGLCCYLRYVAQIHGELYDRGLLPAEAWRTLTLDGWGRAEFRAGRYRFGTLRVRHRLYWRQLATVAAAGEWRAASRLCLVPAMVAACSLGLVGREAATAAETIAALAAS
jgi:hypothetical protein